MAPSQPVRVRIRNRIYDPEDLVLTIPQVWECLWLHGPRLQSENGHADDASGRNSA
jgi:hypothetical protein